MKDFLKKALASCLLSPVQFYTTLLVMIWKKREQITYLKSLPDSFEMWFGKSVEQR